MKKNIKVLSIILITILVPLSTYILFQQANTTAYNTSPDISKKVVGSKSFREHAFYIPSKSIAEVCNRADLIVIGRVVSSGITVEKDLPFPNSKLEEKFVGKYSIDKKPKLYVSQAEIDIEDVLFGQTDFKMITISQLGKAGNDSGETKVRKNDRMLFILKRHKDNQRVYSSTSAEEGLFIIDEKDNKLLSLTDNMQIAKYDGLDLDILKADIKNAIKTQKKQ